MLWVAPLQRYASLTSLGVFLSYLEVIPYGGFPFFLSIKVFFVIWVLVTRSQMTQNENE